MPSAGYLSTDFRVGAQRPPPEEDDNLLEETERQVTRFWQGFVDFAFQSNVLQVAIGLIFASIFTDLVKSFVGDILMPPLSVLLPINKNIEEKFAVLKRGDNFDEEEGYNTLSQALEDGAVVMAYGAFVYQVVSFVMMGFALYGMACFFQLFSRDPIIKHLVKCRYCKQKISEKAQRCVGCGSWQDGREDRIAY